MSELNNNGNKLLAGNDNDQGSVDNEQNLENETSTAFADFLKTVHEELITEGGVCVISNLD